MKKTLAIIAALLLIAVVLYVSWLREGVRSSQWAIELVGGYENLEQTSTVIPEDSFFLSSLDQRPKFDQVTSILSSASCSAPDATCLDNNLAIANVLATTNQDLKTAKKLIEIYSNTSTETCPLKIEISKLLYETTYLANNPDRDAASSLLEQIKKRGGLIHSINNEQCKAYLSERSYFAKAYLFYLTTLISLSDFPPDSTWIYLLYESGYRT